MPNTSLSCVEQAEAAAASRLTVGQVADVAETVGALAEASAEDFANHDQPSKENH